MALPVTPRLAGVEACTDNQLRNLHREFSSMATRRSGLSRRVLHRLIHIVASELEERQQ